jgi:hypothetical protein
MPEPTITCPKCQTEIKLTESLAGPLIAATRREYQELLARKDADIASRETALREDQENLSREKETLEERLAERMRQERGKIASEEAKNARLVLQNEIEDKAKQITGLHEILNERERKLAEAQSVEAEVLRKERELDDAKRELELTVEKRVREELDATREQARKDAEESLNLKMKEREKTITDMQKQIEELKRKAEQGSQQLQGEVQELELEVLLASRFPTDTVVPVPKGDFGGDVLQCVVSPLSQVSGTILWESKRTKNWSDGWLPKLRDDQRAAKAEVAVLVSQALPKGIESFDLVDGIWVAHPRAAIPVAMCLRQMLIEVSMARQASEGQRTKAEIVYQYLIGPRFRQRVEAIVESFSSMQDDLGKEKKAIMKQWAKREAQIERVVEATVGMYGDLQGIAGRSLQEVEGLEFPALEDGTTT